jgi:flagellar motor component MotA
LVSEADPRQRGGEEMDEYLLKREAKELDREVKELDAAIKAKNVEMGAVERSLRDELLPQMRELVAFARKRGHTWMDKPLLGLGGFPPYDDARLADYFVEFASVMTLGKIEHEIRKLDNELAAKRKDLRRKKETEKAWADWVEGGE